MSWRKTKPLSECLRILDTDHIGLYQRGHPGVLARVAARGRLPLAVSAISLEESMRGWLAVIRRARDAAALERAYRYLHEGWAYYREQEVLPFTPPAIERYLGLRRELRHVGPQDLKIAAIALTRGAVLVTRNERHFGQVDGLATEDWTQP